MTNKNSFISIDFRNAKYQGFTKGQNIQGIGIVMDNEYMFCLSNWKKQTPNGSTFIVFPNCDYFYGTIFNKKLTDLCVYVRSNGQKIILNCRQGQPQFIAYIQNNETNAIEFNKTEKGFAIANIFNYKIPPQEKIKILNQILKTDYPAQYQTCKAFIKTAIQVNNKGIIQILQHSGSTFIGFKEDNTLGVQFNKQNKIKALGNYSTAPINLQFGRMYYTSRNSQIKVEEGKFTEPNNIKTYLLPERTPQAYKITDDYFKIGTNFTNKFLNFNYFTQLSQFFNNIKKQIQINIFQYGQKILTITSNEAEQQQTGIQQLKNEIQKIKNRKYKQKRTSRQSPLRSSHQQYINRSPIKHTKLQYSPQRQNIYLKLSKQQINNSQQQNKPHSPWKRRIQKKYLPGQNQHQVSISPFRTKKSQDKIKNKYDKYKNKYQIQQNNAHNNKSMNQIYKKSIYSIQQSPYSKIASENPHKNKHSSSQYVYQVQKYDKSPYSNPLNHKSQYQYQIRQFSPKGIDRTDTIINNLNKTQNKSGNQQFQHYQQYKNRNKNVKDMAQVNNTHRYRKNFKYL